MQSIHGYYNGREIVPLDALLPKPKKNQKVIITILDEFVEPETVTDFQDIFGKLDDESAKAFWEALEE